MAAKSVNSQVGTKSTSERKRLGRGLSSLISTPVDISSGDRGSAKARPNDSSEMKSDSPTNDSEGLKEQIEFLPIDRIEPNRYQPRQAIDESALESLAASIRSAGVMQPIVVRPASSRGGYELIAGERRWRAARSIGLEKIPSIVRRIDDRTAAEWALIENLQREDLNPMDRAEAFERLHKQFGMTHQEIADQVGLNRSSVSNFLRLIELDDFTKNAVRRSEITYGHARTLLAVTNLIDRRELATRAIREGWSVRELEKAASSFATLPDTTTRPPLSKPQLNLADLEKQIAETLGTRVRIDPGRKKGTGALRIEFYSFEHFEGLLNQIGVRVNQPL